MTRISSLLVASTLAILPISAFAQPTAAPAKTAEPTSMTAAAPATTAPITGKSATTPMAAKPIDKSATTATTAKPDVKTNTTATVKPDVKAPATGAKTEVHGMNTTTTHSKTGVPAKTAEPAKS